MKKLILILTIAMTVQCAYPANTTLDNIENSLFGFTYSNESDSKRLERLEQKVYGKASAGQISTRIAKLKKDTSADLMGQEITPKEDTFMEEDDFIVYEKEPEEAATMDYPVINELEKQVFKKELQLKPQSFASNGMMQQDNDFYTDIPQKMAQNYHLDQYGTPFGYDNLYNQTNNYDYDDDLPESSVFSQHQPKPLNISAIEKKLYKKKYDTEPMNERLTRIETSVFGTSFPNDSDSERIARLSSAIQAQKTAKRYDSNKLNQNLATAFQIGTLILMVLACIL